VFRICEILSIDDPVHWMNSVSPLLVDQWIAYLTHKNESKGSDMMDPDDALKALTNGG
jgi:hypothetical protein